MRHWLNIHWRIEHLFEADASQHDILLGSGFTPSAPMMKALLSLSATPLSEAHRNGGDGGPMLQMHTMDGAYST